MKKKLFKLTEQRKHELKLATVEYLRGLHSEINELEDALMAPGALSPRPRMSGMIILEPDSLVSEAHYLHTGLAILYTIDAKSSFMKIFYIWEERSIIVLYEEFREKLPNDDYFIMVIEDSELVSITNFCMDGIYEKHTSAYLLTQKIINEQTSRRMMQTDILLMESKSARLSAFEQKFPNLKGRLTWDQKCAFIGVKKSTLGIS
jgi:hypothetical protein